MPRQTSSASGKNPAQVIDELAADILSKLPADFNLDIVIIFFFDFFFFFKNINNHLFKGNAKISG